MQDPTVGVFVKSEIWMAFACGSSEAVTGRVRQAGTDGVNLLANADSRQDQAGHTNHVREANDGRGEGASERLNRYLFSIIFFDQRSSMIDMKNLQYF
jgi:hypothetical protein